MLGRLRMRTDNALETYNTLAQAIFSMGNKKWKGQDGTFKANTLEKEVKKSVSKQERGERMLDTSTSFSTSSILQRFRPKRATRP